MSKSFLDIPLTEVVPSSLLEDPNITAICESLQGEIDLLNAASAEIELYSRIDELPEPVLRMLAWENRISSLEWTLAINIEEKRALVKDSFDINRRRGTRGSIERIFELLGMHAEIEEWFEYGGTPGTFRISVLELGDRGIDPDEYGMIDMLVLRYKALTRWIESISFYITSTANVYAGTVALQRQTDTVHPFSDPLAIGAATVAELVSTVSIVE